MSKSPTPTNGTSRGPGSGLVLNREQLLAFATGGAAAPRKRVEIPGRGAVYVRTISAEEREIWELAPKHRIRATLVALAACDADGNPLFTLDDVPNIGNLPAGMVVPIFEAAVKQARIDAADVDELEKNSGANRSAGSRSGLPGTSK